MTHEAVEIVSTAGTVLARHALAFVDVFFATHTGVAVAAGALERVVHILTGSAVHAGICARARSSVS